MSNDYISSQPLYSDDVATANITDYSITYGYWLKFLLTEYWLNTDCILIDYWLITDWLLLDTDCWLTDYWLMTAWYWLFTDLLLTIYWPICINLYTQYPHLVAKAEPLIDGRSHTGEIVAITVPYTVSIMASCKNNVKMNAKLELDDPNNCTVRPITLKRPNGVIAIPCNRSAIHQGDELVIKLWNTGSEDTRECLVHD